MNKQIRLLLIIAVTILAGFLRFYKLGEVPPSLNLDEVAIGYNAYSILKTGMDEYGHKLPVAFRSHDDYKAPLYIYLSVIPVALFGLNEFAVRFMSALMGTLTIPIAYALTRLLVTSKKYTWTPVLVALFLSISPWHLQFSRMAFETNVAVFFVVSGITAYLCGLKQPKWWFVTATAFAMSIYTYHSNKLFIPLLLLYLAWYGRDQIKNYWRTSLLVVVVFIMILSPLIPFMLSPESRLRFKGTSVFEAPTVVDLNHDWKIDEWRAGREYQAKLFHSEFLAGIQVVLRGYFSHFSYDFLFHGESGPPKNYTPNVGLLYLWELVVLPFGWYAVFRDRLPHRSIVIVWILLGPLASSLTWDVPSSTRTTILLPTFQILSAVGLMYVLHSFPKNLRLLVSLGSLIVIGFWGAHYLHNYYRIAPRINSDSWQHGYKQMVQQSQKYIDQVDTVVVSNKFKQPHNFFAFYTQYDPYTYIHQDGGTVSGGFDETRNKFSKYEFKQIVWDESQLQPNTLYIDLAQFVDKRFVPLETIYLLNGQPHIVFYIKSHES